MTVLHHGHHHVPFDGPPPGSELAGLYDKNRQLAATVGDLRRQIARLETEIGQLRCELEHASRRGRWRR